jgi:hypothetical protein
MTFSSMARLDLGTKDIRAGVVGGHPRNHRLSLQHPAEYKLGNPSLVRPNGGRSAQGGIKALVSTRGLVILGNCEKHETALRASVGANGEKAGKSDNFGGEPMEEGEVMEVTGRLYERDHIKYLDVSTMKKAQTGREMGRDGMESRDGQSPNR